jgi:GNAT superfamily N-acetyltransferase
VNRRVLPHAVVLGRAEFSEVVDTLADAFHDYPVMRFVCGGTPPYDRRLHRLVELFVSNRVLRDDTIFGVHDSSGQLAGVATTTSPASPDPSPELLRIREEIWGELGAEARQRYDSFVAATQATAVPGRHHHLNMIGIRRSEHGQGYARPLLEAVQELAQRDPASTGVSLTTELDRNRRLYEHFGYRVAGSRRLPEAFTTWTLFRPRDP